jgi:hypothetical protein
MASLSGAIESKQLCVRKEYIDKPSRHNQMMLEHDDQGGGNTEQAFHLTKDVCTTPAQPDLHAEQRE